MNDKQHYELMFIVPAKYAGEELSGIKDKVKDLLAQSEAEITKEKDMGRRRMAYPIDHIYQGFYFVMEMDLPSSELEKIYTALKLMPEVLRYIMVQKRVLSERELDSEAKLNAAVRAELIEKGVIKDDRKVVTERVEAPRVEKVEEKKEEKVETQNIASEVEEKKEEKVETQNIASVEKEKKEDDSKVKLEELDKNLDDIISDDINELL